MDFDVAQDDEVLSRDEEAAHFLDPRSRRRPIVPASPSPSLIPPQTERCGHGSIEGSVKEHGDHMPKHKKLSGTSLAGERLQTSWKMHRVLSMQPII